MLLIKIVLLSIISIEISAIITDCITLSDRRSDTFESLSSLKTNVEIYEGKKLQRVIETRERYSQPEKRSTIHLKTTQFRSNSSQTSETTYYYDGNHKFLLRYSDSFCSKSDLTTLSKHMFHEDVFKIWQQNGVEAETDHIVGVAKLLSMIEKVETDLKRAEFRFVRNLEAVVFKGSLKSQNTAYSDLRFEIIYNKNEMSKIFDIYVLPLHLILNFEWPQEKAMIIIHFYGLERISMFDSDSKSLDHPLFPRASDCGYPIKNFVTSELLERTQKSLSYVSFRAKLARGIEYNEDTIFSESIEMFYSFNIEAKLIRRDKITSRTFAGRLNISSVIYDFNQNKKYNMLTNYRNVGVTSEEILTNDGSTETSGCVSSDISPQVNQNYHHLIELDKLKYLGQTRIRGILTQVFEDDSIDVPPYWLFPSVSVKMNDKKAIEASEFDQIVGPTGSLVLVYYFTPGLIYEMAVGKLLKIEIVVRDNLRKTLTLTKEIHLFDFLFGNSHGNPFSDGREATSLFSLPKTCLSNLDSDMYADVAILFEPKEDNFIREDLALSAERLFQRMDREELTLQALYNNFQLSRLYIENLETKLDKLTIGSQNMIANSWPLPVLKLKMRVNNFDIASIDCVHLGRGRFLDRLSVTTVQVLTFEECSWSAYHHSRATNKEVVFAYHQTNKHINECLINTLYSSNSRTNFSQILGYYPYEYGEFIMYKIQVGSESSNQTGNQFKSWPIIRSGRNYLAGQQITLPKVDKDKDLELVYIVKQAEVSGELYKRDEQLRREKCIDGIGWIQQQKHRLRDQPLVKSIVTKSIGIQNTSIMTKDHCQSMCLLDLECKSYSYCANLGSKQAACALSNIDLQMENNFKSIKDAVNSHTINKEGSLSIYITEMSSYKEVGVRIDKKCSIFSKSYSNLFRKDHPVHLNLRTNTNFIQVTDENECARYCYEQNLSFLRGAIEQELDVETIIKDLEELQNSNEDSTTMMVKLELILNRHSRDAKNLCTMFQYEDIVATGNGSSTTNACIISRYQQRDAIESPYVPQQMIEMTTMSRYKLIEISFYEKMAGFKLLDISREGEKNQNSSTNQYIHLLNVHHQGFNKQILLNMDNIEFCARACILQTHGPKPSCASFDFVQEHNNSTRREYCLLNSQSLHSMKRRKTVEKQVLYADKSIQYWHFEPRESLIIPPDMADDYRLKQILENSYSLVRQFEEQISSRELQTKFDNLSFIIASFGIISGSLLGIRLAKLVIRNRDAGEESEYRSRMVRLVHRLSGLSIDGRHLQNEVRM